MNTNGDSANEQDKAIIYPERLNYGIVSAGFLYKLKFSVQNNTTTPMRIRVTTSALRGSQNTIRLVSLPDIVAPGLEAVLHLELTAEFPMVSKFLVSVAQNQSSVIYSKEVDANIVSAETFKHVKKSLILQKRPIYEPNVTVFANIPNFDTLTEDLLNHSSSATFSEAVLLDDDDIEDLLSLPTAHNVYWDPFSKCLRLDPKLGKVIVDPAFSLEENKKRTAEERDERLVELEEQGFLTINSLARMREDRILNPLSPTMSLSASVFRPFGGDVEGEDDGGDSYPHSAATLSDQEAEEAEQDDIFADAGLQGVEHDDDLVSRSGLGSLQLEDGEGRASASASGRLATGLTDDDDIGRSLASPSNSTASRMSVTSLLAIKRERIERQRRESVQLSASFSETSKNDNKIDKNRTLTMIKGRNKPLTPTSAAARIPTKSEPGKAAAATEKVYIDKYRADVQAAGGEFTPFVMEAHGRRGEEARNLIREITSNTVDDIREEQDQLGIFDIDYVRSDLRGKRSETAPVEYNDDDFIKYIAMCPGYTEELGDKLRRFDMESLASITIALIDNRLSEDTEWTKGEVSVLIAAVKGYQFGMLLESAVAELEAGNLTIEGFESERRWLSNWALSDEL